jgi:hypothetical protein
MLSSIKRKKLLIPLSIILILIVGVSASKMFETSENNEILNDFEEPSYEKSIVIDFDGDGIGEILNVTEKEGKVVAKEVSMELFDSDGNKLAELWDGINLYPTTHHKIVKLNEENSKEYLQWEMAVGPHQIETVFLTIIGDKVHPIYSYDFENDTIYTPFYTSRGIMVVVDVNEDGLVEVIENVDEYPVDAPRLEDENVDELIKVQFGEEGLDNAISDSMIEIVRRENYGKGRGRKVIMAVHSFVDAEAPFFRRLPTNEYEEAVKPLIDASIEIAKDQNNVPEDSWEDQVFMRYSELDQDSKDFNDFVRDFWTHGRPYTMRVTVEDQ